MNSGTSHDYLRTLERVVTQTEVTDREGRQLPFEPEVVKLGRELRVMHDRGNRLFLIGNGGSAGICSHLAVDFSKNGGIRALALNDSSVLTCLGNDYGYEQVFSKQIEWQVAAGDIIVAISSSGRSANILNGVTAARARGCAVYTLSGFAADNPLRKTGDINFYVADHTYGIVEIGHLTILHMALDIEMGWRATPASKPR
ncbi:MAG: SIS domain-containing protein [Pseudolabrys sp.]|nr:SIS domain-containing protein [Pseudolabrys sp.]MDP2295751.1 SIS domain-containing protein [Pseudolabrys sp.]